MFSNMVVIPSFILPNKSKNWNGTGIVLSVFIPLLACTHAPAIAYQTISTQGTDTADMADSCSSHEPMTVLSE